jgi:hypothetical protein
MKQRMNDSRNTSNAKGAVKQKRQMMERDIVRQN